MTGIYNSNMQVHAKMYSTVYKRHLADIMALDGHSNEASNKLQALRESLYKKGWCVKSHDINTSV